MRDKFLEYIEEEKSKGFVESSRVDNVLDSINRYTGREYTYESLPEGLYGVFVELVGDEEAGRTGIVSESLDTYKVTYSSGDDSAKRSWYENKLEPYIDYGLPLA